MKKIEKSETDIISVESKQTDTKEIVPAGKLTNGQIALLDTLRDPAVILLDVTKICKLAGISKGTYYSAFKSETFLAALRTLKHEVFNAEELPVIHQLAKRAKGDDSQSHHYMKMFLQATGNLESEASKPAQIVVVFAVDRPEVQKPMREINKVIEGEAEDEAGHKI